VKRGDGIILKAFRDSGCVDQVVRLEHDQSGDEVPLFVDLTVDQVQLRSLPEWHLCGGQVVAEVWQVVTEHQLRAGGALSHTEELSLIVVYLQQVNPKGVGGDACYLILCTGSLHRDCRALLQEPEQLRHRFHGRAEEMCASLRLLFTA